jgi:molybdate transport system regulatory protein
MKVSARNKLEGTISTVNHGPVSSEVRLDLAGGDTLVAVVTTESAKKLGLKPGTHAVGLVKAPSVIVVTNAGKWAFSARNQFAGTITQVTTGAVNSEVAIRLPGGTVISAMVTNEAVAEMQLAAGQPATALIKASQVIIGVAA